MCHAVKEGGREGDKELQREGACAAACACFVTENTTHEGNHILQKCLFQTEEDFQTLL